MAAAIDLIRTGLAVLGVFVLLSGALLGITLVLRGVVERYEQDE
jgi:hypothetical protein